MRGKVFLIFALFLFLCLPFTSSAQNFSLENLSNRSLFLFDPLQNQIVLAKNADEIYPLASLTKLLTAFLIYEKKPEWNEYVEIKALDFRPGGIPYLKVGEKVRREDLWNLMLVASSNEAALALIRSLDLSEADFVKEMNEKSREWSLYRLHFSDPIGLNPQTTGSAREVAALARIVLTVPKIRQSLRQVNYSFKPKDKPWRKVANTNLLLKSDLNKEPFFILGGKTGFLEESQYNLVLGVKVVRKELKKEKEIIAVGLGFPSNEERFSQMHTLVLWALNEDKKENI